MIDVFGQRLQDGQFGRYLGAGHDGCQRASRVGQGGLNGVDLGRQQRARASNRGELGDAVGRAFGAVGGAKGIVHKDVAQRGQLFRQRLVVLFLAHVHAAVFQQHHLAGCHLHTIDPVGHQRHFAAQQLRQALGHGGQRVFGFELAFGGAAQVAGDHDGSARFQGHFNGGHRGTHARVFGDLARIVQGHVQVGTDKYTLALGLALGAEVGKTQDVHGSSIEKVKKFLRGIVERSPARLRAGYFHSTGATTAMPCSLDRVSSPS